MKPSVRTLAAVLGAGVAMVATSALADDPRGKDRDRDRQEDRDRDRGKDRGRDDRNRDDRNKGDRSRDDRRDDDRRDDNHDRGRDHRGDRHDKRDHNDRYDRHPNYRTGATYPAYRQGVHPIWSSDRWVPNFRGLKRGQSCEQIRYRAPFRGRSAVFAATQCYTPHQGAYVVPGSQVFISFAHKGGRW